MWTAKTVKRPPQQPAHPPIRQLLGAADTQTAHPATFSTAPGTPTTGLRERGNDTSRSTGRSGRQKAATRRNMRREERVTVQGPVKEQQPDGMSHGGGGGGMTPWCVVLVCSGRRQLADRQSLPFPWTLSPHRRWCPSASHRPLSCLSPVGLSFPLYSPFLSLWRLCQWSPRIFPVSLLCLGSTQRGGGGLSDGFWHTAAYPLLASVCGPATGIFVSILCDRKVRMVF